MGRRSGKRLSHLDAAGAARMVDVSEKAVTRRTAIARGRIWISPAAMREVRAGRLKKGAVEEIARLAGVLAAKRTAQAIPLCHPIALEHVRVDLAPRRDGFVVEAEITSTARTGAEMEALHAVSLAALCVYDMVKAVDKEMTIGDVRLVSKTGGRGGAYRRKASKRSPSRR